MYKKQYCTNLLKKKKPKELREWKRDYIRETDGEQMAAMNKALLKLRGEPRSKKNYAALPTKAPVPVPVIINNANPTTAGQTLSAGLPSSKN